SIVVAIAVAAPLSLFGESRISRRTFVDRALSQAGAEDAVIAAMNRERAAYGLRPLRLNTRLALAAGDRMSDLFTKHYFNHVAPDGTQPFVWAERRGYDYSVIRENLAAGYRDPTAVVDGWMHSPDHRANILGRDFDEVGVAVADGSPVRNYTGPTYVAIYGARM